MQFIPEEHTKDFLLQNPLIAESLCKHSREFARSDLASDLEFLSMTVQANESDYDQELHESSQKMAHLLARYNVAWLENAATQNIDVVKISSDTGRAVAHELASLNTDWYTTEIAKRNEVLLLAEIDGRTVAGQLAVFQEKFLRSLSADDIATLSLPIDPNGNTTIAEYMVNAQPKLLSRELLNSHEFLLIPTKKKTSTPGGGPGIRRGYLAHEVAEKVPDWLSCDSCKDVSILSLKNTIGEAVAHRLAKFQPAWIDSEESQLEEILLLSDKHDKTVLHQLAISQGKQWPRNPNAIDLSHLALSRNEPISGTIHWQKTTVAHDLARNSPQWTHHADAAFNKAVLTQNASLINTSETSNRKQLISVAEMIEDLDMSEIALRVIQTGAAFRVSGPYPAKKIDENTFTDISQIVWGLIENEPIVEVQFKLLLALHSTMEHFKTNCLLRRDSTKENFAADLAACEHMISHAEMDIVKCIEASPEFCESFAQFMDINCEPSRDFLSRLIAKVHFENVRPSTSEEDTPNPSHSIY